MGFLEETKVFLSTTTADRIEPGYSKIKWDLKSRLATVNPLYKMKIKCTNVSIPETFARVSPDLENNTLTLVFSRESINGTAAINECLNTGQYIKISCPPIFLGQETEMLRHINHNILVKLHELALSLAYSYDQIPLLFVRRGHNTTLPEIGFSLVQHETAIANDNFPGFVGADGHSPATVNLRHASPTYATAHITRPDRISAKDLIELGLLENLTWKLLTEADIAGTFLTPADVGLSRVLGFSRIASYGAMTYGPNGSTVIYGTTPVDMSGTRFISIVVPDFNINNIEPDTKAAGRTIACLPVCPGNQTVIVPGIQDNPYVTIPQDVITNFQVELRNDRGKLLKVHHDWFIEFNVRIEEPEKIDVYRGTDDLPRLPVSHYNGYDEGMYERANLETVRYVNEAERGEMRERERFTKKHRV